MRIARQFTNRWRSWCVMLPMVLVLALAGCAGDDDEGETPTAPPGETPTQAAAGVTPTVAGTLPPATLSAVNGSVITDGVCEGLIPAGWVDDGTGRGSTTGGHAFTLFGGQVRSDAEWEATIDLIATPAAGNGVESLDRTDDSIYVVYADGRGFEFRKRFGDRYCDFRVTERAGPIPPEEQVYWGAVIESLAPVQP